MDEQSLPQLRFAPPFVSRRSTVRESGFSVVPVCATIRLLRLLFAAWRRLDFL